MTAPARNRAMPLPYTGPTTGTRGESRCVHHPAPGRTDGRGLDLAHHYGEVRAVVFGSYTKRCATAGVDPDDLVSVVCASVLQSNQGPSAYDPSKASVMRYLHLVTASRLSHAQEAARYRACERTGLRSAVMDGEERDAAEVASTVVEGGVPEDAPEVIARLLPALVEEARDLDEEDGEGRGSALALLFEDDSFFQGWREQAIRWVVHEAPDVAEVASWWRCSVSEATRRMDWARSRWEEELRR